MSATGQATGPETWGPECGQSRHGGWILVVALGTILVVGSLFFLLVRTGVVAGPPHGLGGPPYWVFFPVGFVLLWVVVLVAIYPWGGRWAWRGAGGWEHDDATRIVRARYARGEISRDQMVRTLRDLSDEEVR